MTKWNILKYKRKDTELVELSAVEYPALLKHKEGRYYLIIPELCLVAVNNDLEEAYKDLCQQKQDLINTLIDCEGEDAITPPRKIYKRQETFYQLKIFIYKLLIVCSIVGLTFVVSSALVTNRLAQISAADFIKNQARNVYIGAQRIVLDAPEERKKARLKEIQKVVDALRPMAAEFQTLFSPQVRLDRKKEREAPAIGKSK